MPQTANASGTGRHLQWCDFLWKHLFAHVFLFICLFVGLFCAHGIYCMSVCPGRGIPPLFLPFFPLYLSLILAIIALLFGCKHIQLKQLNQKHVEKALFCCLYMEVYISPEACSKKNVY